LEASTSASSSSTGILEDIFRLIPPHERAAFHEMLQHERAVANCPRRDAPCWKEQLDAEIANQFGLCIQWTHAAIVCSTTVGSELAIDRRVIKVEQHKSLRRPHHVVRDQFFGNTPAIHGVGIGGFVHFFGRPAFSTQFRRR